MRKICLLVMLISIFTMSSLNVAYSQQLNEVTIKEIEQDVIKLVNEYRESKGLSILTYSDDIYIEAKRHSKNMADGTTPFSHDGFDGRFDRLVKIVGGSSMAENVAMGQETAQEALESWLSSTGHRENIEGKFNLSAVGIAQGADGDLYFTQIFLLK